MPTFLYRCPNTGFRVQGYAPEQTSDDDVYEVLTCIACKRVHLVNPATGKVMGERSIRSRRYRIAGNRYPHYPGNRT
jgi:hypothetical protein